MMAAPHPTNRLSQKEFPVSTTRLIAAGLAAALLAVPARAQEAPVKGRIVAADLFKNGLAVVRCEATLAGPGTYVLEEVPRPVHGTFWVDSETPVEVVVRMRDVEVPAADAPPGNLQEDLAGKPVTLHLKGNNRPPVSGTMMKLKPAKPEEAALAGRFLVLQTGKGRVYVEASEVASVETGDAGNTVTRRQPRMLLTLGAGAKGETKVALRYLTHGLSWAPSYRVDISDPKALTLEQHAVVRNEVADLAGVEVRLISGYPSVQFAHVRSLLAPRTSLASFFQELASNDRWRDVDGLSNSVATQQAAFNVRQTSVPLALGATPAGEGVDLHYQPIGRRTLAEGDTLALSVAKGKADYERIVEWLVPDARDEYGRYEGRGRVETDDAWDALKFKNPLPFPMTTGPATVTANGLFNGQRMSYWVNSGEETILRVEKALSVRTRATENEQMDKDGRDLVWVGGRQYRKTTVEGEVAVGNHRKETVSMVIRRRFSGELIKAEGAPKTTLLAEGAYSINRRNELVWTLPLEGGEEVKLKYSYSVLVMH
jgi:hypothetical protein